MQKHIYIKYTETLFTTTNIKKYFEIAFARLTRVSK